MARRFRLMLRARFDLAVARFALLRLGILRFERLERSCAIGSSFERSRQSTIDHHSSQSLSRSFFGRYSSVMKEMPRRESASSSYFTPERIISWISSCHCFFWNQR